MTKRPIYNGACVYVVTAKETPNIFKIGSTSSLVDRFKTLRNELKLDIVLVCYIPVENAWKLERSLHKRFAAKRIGGYEWFELDADDLATIQREYKAVTT